MRVSLVTQDNDDDDADDIQKITSKQTSIAYLKLAQDQNFQYANSQYRQGTSLLNVLDMI